MTFFWLVLSVCCSLILSTGLIVHSLYKTAKQLKIECNELNTECNDLNREANKVVDSCISTVERYKEAIRIYQDTLLIYQAAINKSKNLLAEQTEIKKKDYSN